MTGNTMLMCNKVLEFSFHGDQSATRTDVFWQTNIVLETPFTVYAVAM